MKNIRDLSSEDEEGLNSQEYYHLMEIDDLISNNLEVKLDGADSSPIYLGIESGSVVKLNLISCQLSSIPRVVWEFLKLRELDLDRNAIETIPNAIEKLKFLEVLSIADNKLEGFEPLTKLTSLKSLNLADNNIASMPDSIGNLKHLGHLALTGNRLKTLPESIGELKSLRTFYLKDNELEILPEGFGGLS